MKRNGNMSATQRSISGTKPELDEVGAVQPTTGKDAAESMLKTVDKSTQKTTGISLFHILTMLLEPCTVFAQLEQSNAQLAKSMPWSITQLSWNWPYSLGRSTQRLLSSFASDCVSGKITGPN